MISIVCDINLNENSKLENSEKQNSLNNWKF